MFFIYNSASTMFRNTESLLTPATSILRRPSLIYASKPRMAKIGGVGLRARLQLDCENDPLLQAAKEAASLCFRETHRPEPLFVDPYAGCFVHPNVQMNLKKYSHHYCLATKFIDDKVFHTVNYIDGLKQVFLHSRCWAQIPRRCLFVHVPLESSDIQDSLRNKGFSGNQPSIWVIQSSTKKWLQKLFLGNGFRVDMISCNEVAKSLGRELAPEDYKKILSIAEQLRFSDDQIDTWRREFQRVEEEGDEEGFEGL